MTYDFAAIEAKWQQHWEQHRTFHAPNPGEESFDDAKPKFYVLDMFPYPSGVGLHVGHPLGYIATDIIARFQRARGYAVLHPMGYDAFGLPAEQYAIETGVHPRVTTEQNIANMTRQLKKLGLGYDWQRSFNTTDPDYVRWTQWIFIQLYHSYFDPLENKVRPISELERKLEGEDYYLGFDGELINSGIDEDLQPLAGTTVGARKWFDLDEDQKLRLLDEYRLAYLAEVPVNWCPALGTVLANEEVTAEGLSERGNHPVERRPLKQWMLRITALSDRLLSDLELVDWPEPIKLMQRNWIGRSEGADVDFIVANADAERGSASEASGIEELITVFTTRPDTLFGATYLVLAPEHPLVEDITTPDRRDAVAAYRRQAAAKSEQDRQDLTKHKTGEFTGGYAINPVNEKRVPIWVADYVLMGYGTGAIMAVPAHDTRDHAFATAHHLPIQQVITGGNVTEQAHTGDGTLIHSSNKSDLDLNGLSVAQAQHRVTDWLETHKRGRRKVQTKLRDWLFSRQRYWGEPFPVLHELDERDQPTGRIITVPEEDLPVELPEVDDFTPAPCEPGQDPKPPLGRASDDWLYTTIDGRKYRRELNTMPQWAGSCWYYLRFLDPDNDERFVGEKAERYWMVPGTRDEGTQGRRDEVSLSSSRLEQAPAGGVDLYVGGAEHAVLHLLYARFWHKVLYDLGHVSTPEPFGRLYNQGYIQAYAYTDARGVYVPAEEVEEKNGEFLYDGQPVNREFGKMGKSLKNAVAPDDVCREYGADTLRLYEMYLGPLDQSKVWNTRDIVGSHRFLNRVWRNFVDTESGELKISESPADHALIVKTHATIKRVTESLASLSFNTAIAALIELNNELVSLEKLPRYVAETLVVLLAPLAPHVAEELWEKLGNEPSVADVPWPTYDADLLVTDEVELPVQVNGKLRGRITVPADADEATVEQAALADPKVAEAIEGKTLRKVIYVKGKLVNLVVG